jgi:hypothetical protein
VLEGIGKWMLKGYIVWSVGADIFVLGGVVYLIFF